MPGGGGTNYTAPSAVSVVLYVHNGLPYLRVAVEAILSQSHADFELCVVDDGSTDGTAEVLHRLADTDHRIRVHHQVAHGRSRLHETVNTGMALAQHDLIVMANADDIWHPEKLERQVSVLDANPDVDVCTHDAVFIDAESRVLPGSFRRYHSAHPTPPPRPWQFLGGNPIANPTTMFRRAILRRVGMQEVGDMHDHQFWFKAVVHGCRFHGLPDRLLRYRLHEASHSTANSRRDIIKEARRKSASDVASRYGIHRLVPELALAGDDRSFAWAHGFLAGEFWSAGAHEDAEEQWRQALRRSDDPSILAGLGMAMLHRGATGEALPLLQTAAAAGVGQARASLEEFSLPADLLAPEWAGPVPEVAAIVAHTDVAGLELAAETAPDAFDLVLVLPHDETDTAEPIAVLSSELLGLAKRGRARLRILLTDASGVPTVASAYEHARSVSPDMVDRIEIEVDVVPSGELPSLLEAHRRLDDTPTRTVADDLSVAS